MLAQKPPIRVICPGRTYRHDSDQTHTPMFHQVEGLVIDKKANMGHLKWVLEEFCKAFFEVPNVKMRFRPSFFPFTEPSMEVDIQCSRQGGEISSAKARTGWKFSAAAWCTPMCCRNCGLDPDEYQGFAWGMGIDRIAMLKYGMDRSAAILRSGCALAEPLRLPAAGFADARGWIIIMKNRNRIFFTWLALCFGAHAMTADVAAQPAGKPVVLERSVFDGKLSDYTGSWSRVAGLKKNGDGFVSVRSAPDPKAAERDRLTTGRHVYAINPADDWKKATFLAVIYLDDPQAGSEEFEKKCGVDNPPKPDAPRRRNYTGPCKSGWVHKRFLQVLAD